MQLADFLNSPLAQGAVVREVKTKNRMLQAALNYARKGISVFPVNGKLPLTKHGLKDATTDQAQLLSWWEQWPDANIGMATGTPSKGHVVLDIDPRSGGNESFAALEAKYGALPETLESATGGGGRHIFLTAPDGVTIRNSAGKLGDGLDVRGNGGYVVIPPSIHETGRAYAWANNAKAAPAPKWLIEKLANPVTVKANQHADAGVLRHPHRQPTLLSLAGSMRRKGCGQEAIEAALLAENTRRCDPPLPEGKVRELARDISSRYAPAESAPQEIDPATIVITTVKEPEFPEAALCGRLGEICERERESVPLSYLWPAIVTVASAMIPPSPNIRVNLYTALVGAPGTGKSETIKRACQFLGISEPPLLKMNCGSAEALAREVAGIGGQPRLLSPDELGHLLEKAHIENAAFPFILSRAYYDTDFKLRMARAAEANFDCRLSLIGGVVRDRFQDLFNKATTGGFYDRFIFGSCPDDYIFDYFPPNGTSHFDPSLCTPVAVDRSVWAEKSRWVRDRKVPSRSAEIALRVATVCASCDGRAILTASDLGPALEFAQYQEKVRNFLRPNPGENFEARLTHKFLEYLERAGGRWVSRSEILHDTHAYDLGPSTADRALTNLEHNGDIEQATRPTRRRPQRLVRLTPIDEPPAAESVVTI